LGFFKEEYAPWKRGFGSTAGIVNAEADHYTHVIGGGYDWHVNGTTAYSKNGTYSGKLVRDDAVAFIQGAGRTAGTPFFLYLPFQECHAPFQVDKQYADLCDLFSLYFFGSVDHTSWRLHSRS
jgi:arylsulfatase B